MGASWLVAMCHRVQLNSGQGRSTAGTCRSTGKTVGGFSFLLTPSSGATAWTGSTGADRPIISSCRLQMVLTASSHNLELKPSCLCMVIDDGTQSVAKTVKQFRQIEGVFVPAGRLSEISELKCEPSTSWRLHRARTIENVSREDPDMINFHGLNRLTQSFF